MSSALESPDMIYVFYALMALGVFLLITGMGQLVRRSESTGEARSRRMRMIAKGATTAEVLAILKPPESRGLLTRLPFAGNLPQMLRQAGMTTSASRFLFLCGLAAVVVLGLAMTRLPPLPSIGASFVLCFFLPIFYVRAKRDQRVRALTQQLPDALDLMARGLRVGHPLNTSIAAVANEMPDPIGSEFGIIFDQVSYGDELVDAVQEMAERIDIEDLHYLSASIAIQHGTGGDLARVIQVLSKVIRDRMAMRRKVKAISSEGRLTGWFLSALPFVIFGFTSVSSPDYYPGVMDDPLFKPMAAAVIVFTVLNALVLKKLVSFRI